MTKFFTNPINESAYEDAVINIFKDLGYRHVYAPNISDRDLHSPLYEEELLSALRRINPTLPDVAINEALYKIKNFENAPLVQKNYLQIICKTALKFAIRKIKNIKIQSFI